MRACYDHIKPLVELVAEVPGDFGEFGVWHGTTFLPLAREAAKQGRVCHAVDSWRGMAEPTARDIDETGQHCYPRGGLSTGGSLGFRMLMADLGDAVVIHEGFIPNILTACASSRRYAFAHVDLDQHLPTLLTLRWVWGELNPGGIVCCHDWWAKRQCLAAGAANDWMVEARLEPSGSNPTSHHVWWIKP